MGTKNEKGGQTINGVELPNTDAGKPPMLFGAPIFSRVNRPQVYPGRNGRKSCMAIAFTCPVYIGPHEFIVDSAIWGRFEAKADGNETTFEASLPRGFKAVSENAEDAFLAHVETAAIGWDGYEGATLRAANKLEGKPDPVVNATADNKPADKVERPRLVYKPKAVATSGVLEQPPA